ncbi:MAG: tRNA uridine(34) 5-carboxymethylaminomethyl modification radical SAM/GNAT enzyme Elp3 [Candidatus Aenigmarchaeota archaeon]|nr:tRNA uridine(34) 5-carboxymethylaminomethyl modification radical SAM/GNAT enzyme Elp3 [Candidatus Aenigmarchaeota archaeon]
MEPSRELLEDIRLGKIKTQDQLELAKIKLAGGMPLVKNSQISELVSPSDNDYKEINKFLRIKNVRTASGVANIAVMWKHVDHLNSCPFHCIYCPQGEKDGELIAPKSYTGVEPTTLRAIRNKFDPFLQVTNRIKQLNLIGHSTDKCELIIMGGTFMATPSAFQEDFVKCCLDGFNGTDSETLEDAQLLNETAGNRCIGLTIETRADYCSQKHIEQMLRLGCTRVEIGVQSVDDDLLKITERGHDAKANTEAIKRLKENGLKVCVHWMPGLTGLHGLDEEKEISMFSQLFTDDYMPDELKIYPTLVMPGTKLHEMWKGGNYAPLAKEQMMRLLIEFKKIVPDFVRIKRVMRDISEHKADAGAKTTNLRQLAAIRMKHSGLRCRCIRCREVGHVERIEGNTELKRAEYGASGGREIFLSYESRNALFAFLRLRLGETARIRELHVYGSTVPIGKKSDAYQHTGFGKSLMEEAERIAKENGAKKITVTSGIGARDYYRKLGYRFEAPYTEKILAA